MEKKIDYKILKQRIAWTLIMSLIGILFILSVQRKLNANVEKLVVKIKPLRGNRDLISERDVKLLFDRYIGYDVTKSNVKDLEVNELEALLKKDKRVKKVEVFVDAKEKLNVWIVQKQPVVRIMDDSHKSYYIDEEGDKVPTVEKSAIRVPLATGHFELYQEDLFKSDKPSKLKDLFHIAKYIFDDEFLSALIEQIDVNENGDVVLIPKIGRQEIVIGDAKYLEEKFDNLKIMYKEGLPREGWRKFSVLKINYRGQVIGVKENETEIN
jgi:cell division protein FtsQ